MTEARFQAATDLLDSWRDDVLSGKPPTLFPVAERGALARIEVGPGLVTLIGGAPGVGKSALVVQWIVEALRLSPSLRALILNVEMPPAVLLDRQLARLADIDLTLIRHRKLEAAHTGRVEAGMGAMERVADRLAFVRPPFDLENVAASADAFEADIIVLDYLQRIPPPGDHADRRGAVDASMSFIRQFAGAGVALVVVAALSRSKDSKGRSSYSEGLGLASFRETSELEYGCDDAFLLLPDENGDGDRVTLKHLKSRHGETRDIPLRFDRRHQRFADAEPAGPSPPCRDGRLQRALRTAWQGPSVPDDDEGGDD